MEGERPVSGSLLLPTEARPNPCLWAFETAYLSGHITLVSMAHPAFSTLFFYSGESSASSSVKPYSNATSFKKPLQISNLLLKGLSQWHFPSAKDW